MEYIKLTHSDVLNILPERDENAHKGNFGKIMLLCGSRGYTGAAALAAMGALRVGAGLVYLCVPESIYEIEAVKLLEPIVLPFPDKNGMFSAKAIKEIAKRICDMDAVLIGPGIGQSEDTAAVTSWVLENYSGPVVLDADGINVMKSHKDILRGRTSPTILTPHSGEFYRLGGIANADKAEETSRIAGELGVIVIHKGHHTVISDGKNVYINTTGNPGMAVGGCGDILAGMIVGLLGQGISPIDAAACGAWFHGAAGDLCAQELGQYAMLPSDILEVLPRLLK